MADPISLPLPGSVAAPVAVPAPVAPAPVPAAPVAVPALAPAADPRLAQLIAKESALAKERQAFAAERAEAAKSKAWRDGLLKNPAALEEVYGPEWYEKLTEYRLSGNKLTPELVAQSVESKLEEWDRKQTAKREADAAAEATRVREAQEAEMQRFRTETTEFVKGKPDEYELINLHGAHNLVTQVIEQHYGQTQRILSTKEAADLVENHLAEQVKKSLELKRFKQQPAPSSIPQPTTSAQPRTLTNALSTAAQPSTSTALLSEDERMARAIAKGEAVRRARIGGQ